MRIDIYEPVISSFAEMRTKKSDADVYRFNVMVESMRKEGIEVVRHDFESDFNDFVLEDLDEEVNEKGMGILPITFAEGKRVLDSRYPHVDELKKWTGLKDIETPSVEEQMEHLSSELREHDHSHYHSEKH